MKIDASDDLLPGILKSLHALVGKKIMVGIPSDEADRDDGSPINNAELGYLHTYGGTIAIPSRQQSIYRNIDKNGEFTNGGRFSKRSKSNYQTTHDVEAHSVVIPPRPFLEPGIEDANDKIATQMGRAANSAMDGKPDQVDKSLNAAGIAAQNSVKNKINNGPFQALAPSTLASRRSRGRTGEKPLEDSGQMRNSVTYVIREGSG